MSLKRVLFALVMAVVVVACSTISVTTDYDKSLDFTQFKTYSFYKWKAGSSNQLSDFDRQRLKDAVGTEMEKRGYKYVEQDGGGDLTVSLFVVIEKKTTRTAYTDHYADGYYGYDDWDYGYVGGWGYGASRTTYVEDDYIDGTLVIDIFNTSTRKLAWQGVGAGVVEENSSAREQQLPGEIAQIFADFPKPIVTE